jgi:hypothetical protein
MSIRNRLVPAALAIGALSVAGPVAASSAATGSAGANFTAPVVATSPGMIGTGLPTGMQGRPGHKSHRPGRKSHRPGQRRR